MTLTINDMSNYATLIESIQSVIAENGNNEITGTILQQALLSMINSLGTGYQFTGVAQPETNPGTPDQRVFYLASSGTYPNFGPATIPDGNLAVLYYDTSWHYSLIEIKAKFASGQKVSEVSIVNDLITGGADNLLSAEMGKKINKLLSNITTYDADDFYGGSVANYYPTYAISLAGIKYLDIVCYHTNTGQPCIKLWNASNQAVVQFIPAQLAPADSNGCYHAQINLADYPTATQVVVSKGDGSKDQYLYMIAYGEAIESQYLLNLINNINSQLSQGLLEEAGIRRNADAELKDKILDVDAKVGDFNVIQDGNLSTRVTNIESEFNIKQVASDNGVGGVTSATSMIQGGALNSNTFDFTRHWYVEFVVKPVNGYDIKFISYGMGSGGAIRNFFVRINNSYIHVGIPGSTTVYPINSNFNSLGLQFGSWYHMMLLYDGTNTYLYANGVLITQSSTAYPAFDATSVSRIEMNTIHSPKLCRVGYFDENDVVADVVSSHYNGGNPFGYHPTSYDDVLVELLPSNMLKTSIKNTANDVTVTYSSEQSFDILTENPWAAVIEGTGAPQTSPVFVGQKYKDLENGKTYTAIGNSTLNDWQYYATNVDLAQLKTQTKTINGQTIWGSGNIDAGGSGGSGNVISVLNYGATGDGLTDDTVAIQNALEASRIGGKALYFPKGIYLTRKSLILTSNMKVTGESGAVLKNASATLEGSGKCLITRLSAAASVGATSISVSNATGFVVGQEIVIWSSGSYTETMADITAINGNTITIDTSRFTADGTNGGILNAVANNGYVLTDFAMVKTIMTKAAENIVVENITLQPMSDIANEPHIYTSSPINQTKQVSGVAQKNFRVYNVTVLDSANDGISLQGSGENEVVGCRVYNQKHKGIHWGTSQDMIRVVDNYIYGCGSSTYDNPADYYGSGGLFYCVNTHRVIIMGNHIENCYRGIYGFNYIGNGSQDSDTIISNNTFKDCVLYGVYLSGGYRAVVSNNLFTDFGGSAIPIITDKDSGNNYYFTDGVISGNVFGNFKSSFTGPAMNITYSKKVVINGNIVSGNINNNNESSAGGEIIREHCDIVVANSKKVVVTNNIVDGTINTGSGNVGIVSDNNITGV